MESAITCETVKTVRVNYSTPVRHCLRQLRVFPRAKRGSQQVLNLRWRCTPKPDATRQYFDEFGNSILEIRHAVIAHEFCFHMQLITSRTNHECSIDTDIPPVGVGAYLTSSALCDLTAEIRQLATESEDIGAICHRVHRALEYSEGTTHIGTTASQSLQSGVGVCQDFAHLMIAVCRAAWLPARYVSGYNPAEGRMHAWVEVLQYGQWNAWDPTHNRPTRPDCVFVACGRDARDVQPLSGTYRGPGKATLQTWCKTKVIDEVPVAAHLATK